LIDFRKFFIKVLYQKERFVKTRVENLFYLIFAIIKESKKNVIRELVLANNVFIYCQHFVIIIGVHL